MRFRRIRIQRFGPLREVDTGKRALTGFAVIQGPNEAGKSSLFLSIRSLLYGIYPASPERNPWAPWDGEPMEMEAEIERGDGEVAVVHRRLLSAPWGRFRAEGGEAVDLRNDTFPWAGHVSHDTYAELYSLTLPQLARLQSTRGWTELRDRLLAGMGTGSLRAPRKVALELEEEARGLWRPDRRSQRPRDRQLEEELKELSERLHLAVERDRVLRRHHLRLHEIEGELSAARSKLVEIQGLSERIRLLTPLARRLRRMDARVERMGDAGLLEQFPRDPKGHLEELQERAREMREELEAEQRRREELQSSVPQMDEITERLLLRRDRAWALTLEAEVVRDGQERLARVRSRLEGVEEELDRLGSELFGSPEAPIPAETILRLSLSALGDRIGERDDAERRRAESEERLRAAEARPLPEPPEMGFLASGGGLLLAGGALLVGAVVLGLTGFPGGSLLPASLGLAGVILAAQGWLARSRSRHVRYGIQRERSDRDEELRALRAREEELAGETRALEEEIAGLLEGLPLRPERRERPREGLIRELARLQERLRIRGQVREEVQALERGLDETRGRLDTLRRELDGVTLPEDPALALPALARRIQEADSLARSREEALLELRRLEERIRTLERSAESREKELQDFSGLLREVVPEGPAEAAAREVAARLEAREEALRLRAELEGEGGPMPEVRKRVARLEEELEGEGESDPEEVEARLRSEGERLQARQQELRSEEGELRNEVRNLSREETPDMVESAIRALQEERREVRRERDRLWVLARAVRIAERRYREAHQPELTRRAGAYLARITGGRYSGLVLGEADQPDLLQVVASHLPGALPVDEPLSTGTREQVYLALRLAVVDQMDEEGRRLPLILDEIMVNWDGERRARGLDLLAELAEERQILLFTCHPFLAREAEARGAVRVELPPPADG